MSSEPTAIYLGGPHHGKTCPVRGQIRVAMQVGPEGEKRVIYVLGVLSGGLQNLVRAQVKDGETCVAKLYVYRLRRPDGSLEPAEGHEELLGEHASKHGVQFVNPRVQ